MSNREIAFERDSRGECIICGDDKSQRRRGLCIKHYTRYMTSRKEVPENQRDGYDDYLVSKGLLMASQQGRRVDPNENEFAMAVEQFLAGDSPADARAGQLANHLVDQATEEQAAAEPPKKPPKGRAGGKKKT